MHSDAANAQHMSNVVRFGTISEVDLNACRCRVLTGEIVTDYVPWLAAAAGQVIQWMPPSAGEQVILLCSDGDLANAVALRGLYSDARPAPGSAGSLTLMQFADGAQISYDSDAHQLAATLPDGGSAAITAPGGVTIEGDVQINGRLSVSGDASVTGTATATKDVVGGGISLKDHKHTAVQSGGGTSGPPA